MNVHFVYTPEADHLQFLQERLLSSINLTTGTEVPQPAEYEVLVAGRPSREFMAASPHLQAVIIPFSGVPDVTRDLMADFPGVALHNLHHNAPIVAEMAIGLLLAAAKFIVPLDQRLRQHDWTPRYNPSPAMMLAGKTALILGYGAIGQRITEICRVLDMTVLATRRHPTAYISDPASLLPHEIHGPDALHQLLPRSDVLIIALPQTDETRGLIGASELELLRPKAVLVNVGRGPIVEEEALYNALRSGKLRAAAFDVWYNYPQPDQRANTPPSNFPLHELENMVFSPHRGGLVEDTEYYRMAYLAESLNAAAQGEPIPHPVDLSKGY